MSKRGISFLFSKIFTTLFRVSGKSVNYPIRSIAIHELVWNLWCLSRDSNIIPFLKVLANKYKYKFNIKIKRIFQHDRRQYFTSCKFVPFFGALNSSVKESLRFRDTIHTNKYLIRLVVICKTVVKKIKVRKPAFLFLFNW